MDWFRMYNEARKDAKLALLSDAQHRVWFSLMCLAGEQPERGTIAGFDAFELACEVARGDEDLLESTCVFLCKVKILERRDDGTLSFLNWRKRQYEKPSAEPQAVRERVQKHRAKKKVTRSSIEESNGNADVTRSNTLTRDQIQIQIQSTDTENGGNPPNPPVSVETPFAAVAAMCEVLGTDPHVLDAKDLGKQCAKAGELLARGISASEIRDYTTFLRSQSWRDEPIDMFTVAKGIGKWRMNGRPSSVPARASPNGHHKADPLAGIREFSATMDRIEGKERPR